MRFVFRLAVALGIADPIAWMDDNPPEVVDRWILFCAENPLPDSWLQTATIASEIYNATQWVASRSGTKLDHRSINHWMPDGKPADDDHNRAMTADQSRSWIERQIGINT